MKLKTKTKVEKENRELGEASKTSLGQEGLRQHLAELGDVDYFKSSHYGSESGRPVDAWIG